MKFKTPLLLLSILLISFGLRIINLNQSFWLDEAAQVIESARPLTSQLDIQADFQPPLFHILLHFWMMGGKSEWFIRLFSVFLGVGAVGISFFLGKTLKNEKLGLIMALFLAFAPFHIWYSQEARPYALSVLLALISTYLFLKKNWIGYTVSSILFLYTVYLAPFLFIAQMIYIFIFERKKLRPYAVSFFFIGLSFIPWFPFFKEQLTGGTQLAHSFLGWSDAVGTPLFKALPLLFAKFTLGRISFDNKVLYAGLVGFLGIGSLFLTIRAWISERKITGIFGVLFGLVILQVFFVSFFIPIFAPQRLLFVLPFFLGIIALGVLSLSRIYRNGVISLISLISFLSLTMYYTQPRFQREQWRQAVTFVEAQAVGNSLVVHIFPDTFAPWQWYQKGVVPALGIAPQFMLTRENLDSYQGVFASNERIFLFDYLTDLTDRGHIAYIYFEENGFSEKQVVDFPGVGFVHIYEKALAHN